MSVWCRARGRPARSRFDSPEKSLAIFDYIGPPIAAFTDKLIRHRTIFKPRRLQAIARCSSNHLCSDRDFPARVLAVAAGLEQIRTETRI